MFLGSEPWPVGKFAQLWSDTQPADLRNACHVAVTSKDTRFSATSIFQIGYSRTSFGTKVDEHKKKLDVQTY